MYMKIEFHYNKKIIFSFLFDFLEKLQKERKRIIIFIKTGFTFFSQNKN
jgi:hypothetical protein